MIANNPHLQKKRCSKKGLGRSIMRRITEIPESVSRQCSREDKEGADHGNPKNNTSSSKNKHQDSNAHNAKSKEDSKHRPFSLKKSHSTYDHLRGPNDKPNGISPEKTDVCENAIRTSVNGKKPGHREAEELEVGSAESVPLVCKSASAHNLSLDKKPLHPSLSVIQKSLSAIANSKDKSLGLSEPTKSVEDSDKYQRADSNENAGQKGMPCSDKEENLEQHRTSSPIEETPKAHKPGIMKQQALSLTLADTEKTIDALGFKDKFDIEEVCPWEMYDLTPTTVPSENKVQKHVSIAPLDSEKNHTSRSKSKSHNRSKTTDQAHHQSKQKSPGKSDLNAKDSQEQVIKDENAKKSQSIDTGPIDHELLTKQTANLQEKERKKNPPIIEGALPSAEGHHNSNNNLPQTLAYRAEVCPWDFESQDALSVMRSKDSPTSSALSPVSPSKDMPTSPSKKKGAKSIAKKDESSLRGQSTSHEKEMDPVIKMDKSKSAEVCSIVGDHSLAVSVNKGKSTSNQHGIDKCKLEEVCPWESVSTSQSDQDTESSDSKQNKTMQKSNMVDICPWDYDGGK